VDMLALVTGKVQQEESQLHFDFISTNSKCIELLRRLRNLLVTDVRRTPRLLENQNLFMTAGFILEQLSHESNISARYRHITERLVEETILREGDKETEGAKLRCAGNQGGV
jgi:2-phospho-L-lactate transferase/gluconeogenesis factor (CofD/UPF0052 family)